MKHDIPTPNPFITQWLIGSRCRDIMLAEAIRAHRLFVGVAGRHADTGREVASARPSVGIGGIRNDRWIGRLTIGGPEPYAPYTLSAEYGAFRRGRHFQRAAHDLNATLNLMAAS